MDGPRILYGAVVQPNINAYFNITPPTPGTPILAMNFDPDVKVNSPIGYGKAIVIGFQLKNYIDGSCAYFNITPPTPGTPILAMNFDPDVKVNSPIGYGKMNVFSRPIQFGIAYSILQMFNRRELYNLSLLCRYFSAIIDQKLAARPYLLLDELQREQGKWLILCTSTDSFTPASQSDRNYEML
ncbi:hypothetical protein DdX_11206 [Ditylenchus destructor]|uniref:F-box domain-containing protein n=1 Tax=Ditylenchus destructor TaxID=166010 RepID=A0AAD4N311_9BILA|nr:hypothetical protein DdX_11206 [Ditylenchus destructor]